MLGNTTALWEVVVRVAVISLALIAMVRVAGKREIGQLSPLDLLAMLVLSETVSPALTAQDTSLAAALVAAATLLGVTVLVSRLTHRFPAVERLVEGTPTVIARDGHEVEEAMRKERITRQELDSALRAQGVETVAEVRIATVEPSGAISVVPERR